MQYSLKTNQEEEFVLAFHGKDFYGVLCEFDQSFLRQKLKYETLKENQADILEEARQYLYDLMNEYGVNFDMVG